jgi:iron(III) transport system permease protein
MVIYESVDYGFTPIGEAAALGTVLFWVTAFGIYMYQRLTRLSRRYVTVSGKGSRPREITLGVWRWPAMMFAMLYLLLAVVLPVGMLILGSFMKFLTARLNTNVFTLRNYEQLYATAENALAIRNTLFLAFLGATVAVLLAALISSVVLRTQVRSRGLLDYLAALPISVPSVVLALGMLSAYNYLPIPIYGTIWILLLAYVTRFIGHGVRIVSSAMLQIDPELEEAARVTGASPSRTFFMVTLPLLRSSLSSAWTLLFAFMIIEVSTTLFLYATGTITMSVVMWNKIQMTGAVAAYPMAVLQCVIVFIVLAFMSRGNRRLNIGNE